MAIKINLKKTDRILFCGSKWWGDPDMPQEMQYPTIRITDEGESIDYPLTFICQINCEDIAAFDPEGKLPHEGMLYFFAAIDEWLGYESATGTGAGEWPKGEFVVKYAKTINFETFQSHILVDDEDQPLTDHELEMVFSPCGDNEKGLKLLGLPCGTGVHEACPDMINFLQLCSDEVSGLDFGTDGFLNLLIKERDLGFGNWKKTKAVLQFTARTNDY